MPLTAEAILAVIASEAGIDEAALKPEATLIDLEIGSLDLVSIIFELEDQFGIELEPENFPPDASIAQFIDLAMALSAK